MPAIVYRVNTLLCRLIERVPLGTNLALLWVLWMILSGRLLRSRGAVVPGLADSHLTDRQVRRSWAALAHGRWTVKTLLAGFWRQVQAEGRWHANEHEGYRPVVCDLVGIYRPRLRGCPTKHYSSFAGQQVPGIRLGVVGPVGQVGGCDGLDGHGQRVLVPYALVRAPEDRPDVPAHRAALLEEAAGWLGPQDILVADAEFSVREVQAAGVSRYLVRARRSFTARRAQPPAWKGRGCKPTRGEVVRPLPHYRKGRVIEASPPDREETWELFVPGGSVTVVAQHWDELTLTDAKAGAATFAVIVVRDPRYDHPLLLATSEPSQSLSGKAAQSLYLDRWPVEQVPQTGKQILGAAREFVFAPETCQRLPELALLCGAVANYVAACEPAMPCGFWDRQPKSTAGRLRRVLSRVDWTDSAWLSMLPEDVRKKASRTDHLPKGVAAHRRRPGEHRLPKEARRPARQAAATPL